MSILNTGRGWGICIGVEKARPEAFYKDVIRLCAITAHPKVGEKCPILQGFAMTPEEAINVGVNLIKATSFGDALLRKMEEEKSGAKQADTS
jgi:hypothetical protein